MNLDWGAIYRREAAAACRALRRRLPARLRSRFEPLDFVHAAFLQLIQSAPAGLDADRVGALILHVARCRMVDQCRRADSRRRGHADLEGVPDPAPACELLAEADERLARTLDAARGAAERRLVRARAAGHSPAEAAALAGLGRSTAERALARLRPRG